VHFSLPSSLIIDSRTLNLCLISAKSELRHALSNRGFPSTAGRENLYLLDVFAIYIAILLMIG
jgi:hypothetical protein